MKSDFAFPLTCGALCAIGLHCAIAPINVMETVETQAILIANEDWNDLESEVALDSGAVIHVYSLSDCPGYELDESPGSKRGQVLRLGDGGTIPNFGQMPLNLCDDQGNDARSVFQIAAVTRPLMSVGRICDEGHGVTLNAIMSVVRDSGSAEICRFTRQPGVLYVATMKLRSPMGFATPE